jgi:uncharacterized protein YjbJ (UPF0337 family)
MKFSSLWQQTIRTVQFSLVALVCSVALNFGNAAPTLAAQVQAPSSHLALFGWGEKAEGKAEQLVGKAQSKTGKQLEGTAKQINGRAKYDLGRVEDAAQRAKDARKSVGKNMINTKDDMKNNANNAIDSVKTIINK